MLKKFTEGLAFGGGFGVSFIALWYLTAYVLYPMFLGPQMEETVSEKLSELNQSTINKPIKPEAPFHELTLDQKINKASFIAIAEYQKNSNGKITPIIKDFLKEDPKSEIYYKRGDEFKTYGGQSDSIDYLNQKMLIFFVGSPASMRYSTTYTGDRIHSLGGIPEKLLRDKCKKSA